MAETTPVYTGCKPCTTCKRLRPLGQFSRIGMGLRKVCDPCRSLAAPVARTCVKCGEMKPMAAFIASGMLRRVCADPCFREDRSTRYWGAPQREGRERPPRRPAAPVGFWYCTKCGECKSAACFPKAKNARGHGSWCKECVARHNRARYTAPEVRADRLARRQRWGDENPTWDADWRRRNLERARDNGRAAAGRRRARQLNLPVEPYTVIELLERDGADCVLCSEPLDLSVTYPEPLAPTIEHLECISWPDSAGDVPSNCSLAHFRCNSKRGDRPHPAAARKRAELLAAEQAAS